MQSVSCCIAIAERFLMTHIRIENGTRHPVRKTSSDLSSGLSRSKVTDLAKSQTVNNKENAIDAAMYRSWSTEVTPVGT